MLSVPRQRRAREMRVGRNEARRIVRVEIGEIAAPAAADEDFRARFSIVLDHQHAASAPACVHRRIEPRRASADDDGVKSQGRSNCTQAPFAM